MVLDIKSAAIVGERKAGAKKEDVTGHQPKLNPKRLAFPKSALPFPKAI